MGRNAYMLFKVLGEEKDQTSSLYLEKWYSSCLYRIHESSPSSFPPPPHDCGTKYLQTRRYWAQKLLLIIIITSIYVSCYVSRPLIRTLHIVTHLILTKIPWGIWNSILQMRKTKLAQIASPWNRTWKKWEIKTQTFGKNFHVIRRVICLSLPLSSVENYDIFCKNYTCEIYHDS